MGIEVFPIPASGPSLAEITSAITSNAAPATVTMPAITSSITTNAASSGVTMAAITSAITTNAASSGVTMAAITSAITTNAASSGVTLAAIGTQVANNSSPFGGTWANVGVTSPNGTNTLTFSGLSGYKFYRLYVSAENFSNSAGMFIRLNGDSSSIYNYFYSNGNSGSNTLKGDNTFSISPSSGSGRGYFVDIPYANSTSVDKHLQIVCGQLNGTSAPAVAGCVWASTAAISSIQVYINNGTCNWYARLLGAN
jgi:hypothetical protein